MKLSKAQAHVIERMQAKWDLVFDPMWGDANLYDESHDNEEFVNMHTLNSLLKKKYIIFAFAPNLHSEVFVLTPLGKQVEVK